MLVTNTVKVINTVYDSVLDFSVEYIEQLRIAFCKLGSKKLIGGLNMTYRNNYMNENRNIKWTIAVYIKKHFSLVLGNVLLNVLC